MKPEGQLPESLDAERLVLGAILNDDTEFVKTRRAPSAGNGRAGPSAFRIAPAYPAFRVPRNVRGASCRQTIPSGKRLGPSYTQAFHH